MSVLSYILSVSLYFLLPVAVHGGGAPRVVNSGVGGENSAEVAARFHAEVASVHPSYVFIFVGMNDAANPGKFLSVSQSISNIEKMILDTREEGAVPILITVQHVDTKRLFLRHDRNVYGPEGPNGRIDHLDEALEILASRRKVRVADFRAALDRAGGPNLSLSVDGVHSTKAGYHLLAETARSMLPQHLPRGTTILCIGDSTTLGIGVLPPASVKSKVGLDLYPTYPTQLRDLLSADSPN